MAKEFLDSAEIGAAFEQVGGESMPQRVGGKAASRRQSQAGFFDQALNFPGIQTAASKADEDGDVPQDAVPNGEPSLAGHRTPRPDAPGKVPQIE